MGAAVASLPEDDDGYVTPDFDLPSQSDPEDDVPLPKRQKSVKQNGTTPSLLPTTLEEEEELALQLLRR